MTESEQSQQRQIIEEQISTFLPEMIALRQEFHMYPELAYQEKRTAAKVAELLRQWGYEVHENIGRTGVVGTISVGSGGKTIGLRADMDALPIEEQTNLAYSSKNSGVMHACGHDGHTTMLLTAAKYLAQSKNFNGTLRVIFQPAEEGHGGAKAMIDDGLFEKFPCDAVFGLHNWPGIAEGHFHFVDGPIMPSADQVFITLTGRGGHGAAPHTTIDPVVAAASIVMSLQTIVARNVPPLETAVVSVGQLTAGQAPNVIPDTAYMALTVRAFSDPVRDLLQERIESLVQAQAQSFAVTADIHYQRGYPVLVNHDKENHFAADIAENYFGADRTDRYATPLTPSEDFAYMVQEVPGAYFIVGNGRDVGLHSANYDFNDNLILPAATYWALLTQNFLK